MILFEYPFNERIRTYLRLEHLFRRLGLLMSREHPVDHHFALVTLFEAMDVAARADLKSDVMKDLERQKGVLAGYRGNPAIAEAVLDQVIGQLDACFDALNHLPGKIGQPLADNDWLMGVRSRIGIPGGTCEFDLPGYHAWQQMPPERRREDLGRWAQALAPLADSVRLLLQMLHQHQRQPQAHRIDVPGCKGFRGHSGHRLFQQCPVMPVTRGRRKAAPAYSLGAETDLKVGSM